MSRPRNPITWLLIGFVRLWRAVLSPLYGNVCKYYPSCSAYGLQSLQTHGALKGSWLTIRRIGRCHPWARGGYDPVPGTPEAEQWSAELASRQAGHDHNHSHPHESEPQPASVCSTRGDLR